MLGKSFTYTYDKGGNIVSRSEYAYTTGTLGTATDTIDYAYDVTWKDELTEYDGMSIAYNEIGNPLTYTLTQLISLRQMKKSFYLKADGDIAGRDTGMCSIDTIPVSPHRFSTKPNLASRFSTPWRMTRTAEHPP